jgi:hypothetical protein
MGTGAVRDERAARLAGKGRTGLTGSGWIGPPHLADGGRTSRVSCLDKGWTEPLQLTGGGRRTVAPHRMEDGAGRTSPDGGQGPVTRHRWRMYWGTGAAWRVDAR